MCHASSRHWFQRCTSGTQARRRTQRSLFLVFRLIRGDWADSFGKSIGEGVEEVSLLVDCSPAEFQLTLPVLLS